VQKLTPEAGPCGGQPAATPEKRKHSLHRWYGWPGFYTLGLSFPPDRLMTDTDLTLDPAEALPHRLGAIAYRLKIPAIDLAGYVRMQLLLVRPSSARGGRRSRWSFVPFMLVCCVVGVALGVSASVYDWSAELWFGTTDGDAGWVLGGRGVIVLGFLLVAVTTICGVIALQRAQFRVMRNIHAAGGELFGAHDLLIGEGGVYLHNVARSAFVPWSSVTRVAQDKDGIFIVADHVSAFWITADVMAALPDRDAFMRYLEQRMAEHPRADRSLA
jgi:hypothetical protein